jgi:acetyl/propionyl-CoA carboxylase alpha subunit
MNQQFSYQIGERIKTVTVERVGDHFHLIIDGIEYHVAVRQHQPGRLELEVNGRQWCAYVASDDTRHYIAIAGEIWTLERPRPQQQRGYTHGAAGDAGSLAATMPGLVHEVLAVEGAEVKRGDTLVILEAMKMELRVTAPYAGRVGRVQCMPGQVVERGQILVEMEEQT